MRRLTILDRSPASQSILDKLRIRVAGQDGPLAAIAERIAAHEDGLYEFCGDRPIGSFLLLGPTGCGKTKSVEATAEVLHNDPRRLLKVNGGEYGESHEKLRLCGAPPSYLGHRETEPALSQARIDKVRGPLKNSLAIVLFDEVDKMHPKALEVLLSILDKGQLETGDNKAVSFRNTLVFFTANFASRDFERALTGNPFNMQKQPDANPHLDKMGVERARKSLAPEFFNRLDDVFVYKPLDHAALERIFEMELDELRLRAMGTKYGRSKDRALMVDVTLTAREQIIKEGTDLRYGARNLKRVMEKRIMNPWMQLLARGELGKQCEYALRIDVAEDGKSLRYDALEVGSSISMASMRIASVSRKTAA